MSQQNHPNFHAVKFVTDITASFFDSIRNKNLKKEDIEKISDQVKLKICEFVADVERLVDCVSENKCIKEN